MPAIQTTQLSGPGTFGQAGAPALNTPVTVNAAGSVAVSGSGYLVAVVTDSISGRAVCGIADMIRPSELLSGVKAFAINASAFFTSTANLQISVSTRQMDGADSSTAPTLGASSLSAFSAAATAQGTVQ